MTGSIRWLGHAFFEYTTADDKVVLFDPWTADDGNPACLAGTAAFDRADLILVSHDHFDHIGSAGAIARNTGAMVGAMVQTAGRLMEDDQIPAEKVVNSGMGFGAGGGFDLGWIKAVSTPAFHSSDTGNCVGYIVTAADGTTVYHAGDTSIFGDMALFSRLYPIDVAMVPIGGVFTMDPNQAAEAVKLLQPKKVIPMHYASFPVLVPTADEFKDAVGRLCPDVEVIVPQVGEKVDLG